MWGGSPGSAVDDHGIVRGLLDYNGGKKEGKGEVEGLKYLVWLSHSGL